MTISEWQQLAYDTAKSKGWHSKPIDPVVRVALAIGELSEAIEEIRSNHAPSDVYFAGNGVTFDLDNFNGDEVAAARAGHKPEGFGIELADCVIRILDLCAAEGIDLEEALTMKQAYNEQRSWRHGGKAL